MDSFQANIDGVSQLVESDINKLRARGADSPEGKTGEDMDVLDLPMSNAKLLKLRDDYESAYATYETAVVKPTRERNLKSYLGRNNNNSIPGEDEIVAANLQFESEETFLPAATAQDPSPFVFADNSPQGNKLAGDVQTMLQFHAQQLLIRRKIAVMVRQWSINHLGVLKIGWNEFEVDEEVKGDVSVENRKIQDFIFDPHGFVDVYGDFSSWLGERIYVTAEKLCDLFPEHTADIILEVEGKMGTEVCYTEWWDDKYCFSTFKKIVLDKHKNEFFNYRERKPKVNPLTGQATPPKRNHFAGPKKPYVFLSVFSLQERPHDITGLIEQNIPNQRKITKRVEQIDNNISQANNGLIFPEDAGWTQETAKIGYDAVTKKGHGGVLAPRSTGANGQAPIIRLDAPNFPQSAFDDLTNSENHLRSSWGTQGIASQEAKPDETARGMTLNQGRDTSRIGGGIGDVIEQSVAKGVFDWLVQLYCVMYDEPHFGAVLGSGEATNYVTLQASDMTIQLIVGVSPNSMQPKDEISVGNQAMSLFEASAIGPKTLLERVSFPDADEAAGDGALYKMSLETDGGKTYLQMNFPQLWQQVQHILQQQQQEQAQAQQQELAMQGAQGQQQLEQKGAAGQQQLAQGQAAHEQKLQHGAQEHAQKIQQSKEMASAKLAAATKGTGKK